MSSCFGLLQQTRRGDDHEPLLPRYNDDTTLQRRVHEKLHTYLMIRALGKGYMPSNEQAIVYLRTLLASNVLNPDQNDLSESGRLVLHYTKLWLHQFIELIRHKNNNDQIQDFIWYLAKARISVDVDDIAEATSKTRAKADTAAAYESLKTVGSLLLTNSDVRLFLSDLSTVAREVFKDTAFSLSEVAEEAGKKLEPSREEQEALKHPGGDQGPAPSHEELENEVAEVSKIVGNGIAKVAKDAEESLVEKVTGDEKETLLYRLKQAVLKLRQRRDYSDSVSVLSLLLKRYISVYTRAVQKTIEIAKEDIEENAEADIALDNFWAFLTSFGDSKQWEELERRFKAVMEHAKNDPQFEEVLTSFGNALQDLLTDPRFFDHADAKFKELREKSRHVGSGSTLREDMDALLAQSQATLQSVLYDQDITSLLKTSTKLARILSPANRYTNTDLVADGIHVFVPALVQTVQHVPIPRLEVSTLDIDLLLENLVLEPGKTINHTSFLPYKLRVETYNDLEIRKARFRTTSIVSSLVTIKIDGLSIRADDFGFWLRAHTGLLRLADEGIASFRLDERGIDIHLDVEIGQDRLEKILSLRAVRVHIHKLDYTLRKSKFTFLGWLIKPFMRPIIRKVIEKQLAYAIADNLRAANRELLFARERLRATRIADPKDLLTFFKAVMARLTPQPDPDSYARIGVEQPGEGIFKGVYTPGSIVKLWNEEAASASLRVEEHDKGGWRNEIFEVHATQLA